MIVRKTTKGYEIIDGLSNINFYPEEDNYVIDETTVEGKILMQKIIQLCPNYDYVLDGNNLIDVTEITPSDPRYIEFTVV